MLIEQKTRSDFQRTVRTLLPSLPLCLAVLACGYAASSLAASRSYLDEIISHGVLVAVLAIATTCVGLLLLRLARKPIQDMSKMYDRLKACADRDLAVAIRQSEQKMMDYADGYCEDLTDSMVRGVRDGSESSLRFAATEIDNLPEEGREIFKAGFMAGASTAHAEALRMAIDNMTEVNERHAARNSVMRVASMSSSLIVGKS